MKKKSFVISLCAAAGILASSCSQEAESIINGGSANTYSATVENTVTTRSYNDGDGAFVWSHGDNISAFDGQTFQTMTFNSGAGTSVATYDKVSFTPQGVAVFPATAAKSYAEGSLTVTYPTAIVQSSNANDPLVAKIAENQTKLLFTHVGGIMAFKVKVPAGADNLVVTTDKAISGDFNVDMTGTAPVVTTSEEGSGKSVKFTFEKVALDCWMDFYLPVPTGTYSSIKIAAMSGNTELKSLTNQSSNTIARCDWTKFTIDIAGTTWTGTIEQPVVKGVEALNTKLANTDAATLAQQDITIDLNNETFTNSDASAKNITSITASSLTLQSGTVNATGLKLTATGDITLKDVKFTGDFAKANSNARISINTPGKVVIDGVDFTETTSGYNCIEINLSGNPISSNVEIKNCKFGSKPTNNCISIFGVAEGGVVNIKDCDFTLNSKADAIRISNRFNANKFTVNITNCSYKYDGTTTESFILFQDYTSGVNAATNKQFSGLVINCDNVTKNGTKVTELGTLSSTDFSNQFAYVWYDKFGVQTDKSHYPTFTFK